MTWSPASRKWRTKRRPTKPAPPVTRTLRIEMPPVELEGAPRAFGKEAQERVGTRGERFDDLEVVLVPEELLLHVARQVVLVARLVHGRLLVDDRKAERLDVEG